jgi:hypothetical protein
MQRSGAEVQKVNACGAVRAFELATVGRVQLQLCVR